MESYESLKRGIFERGEYAKASHLDRNPDILDQLRTEGYTIIEPSAGDRYEGAVLSGAFAGMGPIGLKYLNAAVAACRLYASGYIVTDSFGNDHNARTPWRNSMHEKYGEAYSEINERNKFRLNKMDGVVRMLDRLKEQLDKDHIQTKESDIVRKLVSEIPAAVRPDPQSNMGAPYNYLPFDEKMAVVHKMEGIARTFLRTVIEPSAAMPAAADEKAA